jgi:tetratricopeptide (TPR) repeat protein
MQLKGAVLASLMVCFVVTVLAGAPRAFAASVVEDANNAMNAHKAGDLTQAYMLYSKVIESKELDPDDNLLLYAYNNRGQINLQRGNQAQAFEDFNAALRVKPDPTALYNRGHIYAERNEREKALADFNQALELNPKYSKAYEARGELLLKMGKPDQGRADLNKSKTAKFQFEFR